MVLPPLRLQEPFGLIRLGLERCESRDVIVPFDQGRQRPASLQRARIKRPNRLADGTVMRIDEKALVLVRLRLEMSGEMDFPHMLDGEVRQDTHRRRNRD